MAPYGMPGTQPPPRKARRHTFTGTESSQPGTSPSRSSRNAQTSRTCGPLPLRSALRSLCRTLCCRVSLLTYDLEGAP